MKRLAGPIQQWWLAALGAVVAHLSFAAEVLPQTEMPFRGKILPNVKDSTPDWPGQAKAPESAPNIVIILLDDVGFAAANVFGGPAQTPEMERLAAQGLRYNRFHVTALCSPTRAALLTGRNDHRVGFGGVVPGGFPGYNFVWRADTASIAEILRRNGYSTAAFGKWHNTPKWEIGPVGPFDRWPTGLGFEHFYGSMVSGDSQWEPSGLYRDTTPIEPPGTAAQGYHFTSDIINEAVRWVQTHESLAPEKPYFIYVATGATHAPNHVPKEWIDKYRGQFDVGWDRLRAAIFERQKRLGVIPADTALTPRPPEIPAWSSLPRDTRRLLARQMEVYAAFLAHTDHEVGRLLRVVQDSPQGDNTLILYIAGDNGASGGNGLIGDETGRQSVQTLLAQMDDLGGPRYPLNQYAAGWAWAMSTPFQWQKFVASHLGGTRNPLIAAWPRRIKDQGGFRSQYTHVNDVAATLYDVTGIRFPSAVDGVEQQPLDGVSFAESFTRADAPSRHRIQVYEQYGNRAIYQDGWIASARHGVPWIWKWLTDYDYAKDRWELYHLDEDFSQARDVAAQYPQKLKDLRMLFDAEAHRNDIYPLGGATSGNVPSLTAGKRKFLYHAGLPRIPWWQAPDFSRSHRITANVVIPDDRAEGVILAYGSRYGGFAFYIKGNHLIYESNSGTGRDVLTSQAPLTRGKAALAYEFVREGAESNRGRGRLYINGQMVGEASRDVAPIAWGAFGVGQAFGSSVSSAFSSPFAFSGTLERVAVELN